MLPIDIYPGDPINNFLSDFSTLNYLNHIGQSQPHYRYILNHDQQNRWKERIDSTNILPSVLFFASLVPIFFHKRIPKLKNFTTKKARFGFAILFLAVPISVGSYFSNSFQSEVMQSYKLHEADFKKYRLTGDYRIMNDKLRVIDI